MYISYLIFQRLNSRSNPNIRNYLDELKEEVNMYAAVLTHFVLFDETIRQNKL